MIEQTEAPWLVVLTEPQQDISTVWRLHELGEEMFVPVVRRRVKTGRINRKSGHKETRVTAKPMFPGYGFLRATTTNDPDGLVWRERNGSGVRGVREFMRDINGRPIRLPHGAVMAVFRKQSEEQLEWLKKSGGKRGGAWKRGDNVRIDSDGGAFAGLVGSIDKIDARGRIEILFGMIRHSMPADMVVAV